jgi:hyperosmotically inducible protein
MNTHFTLLTAVLVLATACAKGDDHTTHASSGTGGTTTTGTNSSAGHNTDQTAQSQSNAKADLDHLAEIRKSIVGDDTLSVSAKNVQIMTRSGNVLLRGKVSSATERDAIERHARASAATVSVDDQVQVETK